MVTIATCSTTSVRLARTLTTPPCRAARSAIARSCFCFRHPTSVAGPDSSVLCFAVRARVQGAEKNAMPLKNKIVNPGGSGISPEHPPPLSRGVFQFSMPPFVFSFLLLLFCWAWQSLPTLDLHLSAAENRNCGGCQHGAHSGRRSERLLTPRKW